jgi:hypothetical protein
LAPTAKAAPKSRPSKPVRSPLGVDPSTFRTLQHKTGGASDLFHRNRIASGDRADILPEVGIKPPRRRSQPAMATYTFRHYRLPPGAPAGGRLIRSISIQAADDNAAIKQAEDRRAELVDSIDFAVLLSDAERIIWDVDLSYS